MVQTMSRGEKIGYRLINVLVVLAALVCLAPLVNVLALSFSSRAAAEAGRVSFWPVGFTVSSYRFIVSRSAFLVAFWVSVKRVLLGTAIDMALIVLAAYPLSRESRVFKTRTAYAWFFLV